MLVDSHCHLNYEGMTEDQPELLARARGAGVTAMLNISTRESEWGDVIATAEREDDVWASVGIHPHEADDHEDLALERLIAASEHPRVVGIGETGLDYYYDHSDRQRQQDSMRLHIAAARETGLPMIIHMRDAEEDTIRILGEERERGLFPCLIHCFTAGQAFADQMLHWDIPLSLSGIVTFKNARELQDVARKIPSDKLLIETDSPFLAPVPHRGKRGEPAYVRDTGEFVANLRGEEPQKLFEATALNFYQLFNKAQP
ncbi:TatD family hydrolase [Alterisphingorhabdus coralli]|uniref:TatD family hydrolase n=1 Tax=Alterisphingorhabdus coralli TaxID=3071408 RepID=A0AA97HZN6_9SPHN|nr:TatD family hydrolase [Parasphingorhabdus sp. SCSIO 66989]WOE74027.1 TatD family hydrolase [Parasphingorhabdus sp. SCSIO 66989]